MFGECHAHMLMNGYNYKEAVNCHSQGVRKALVHNYFQEYVRQNVTFIRDGGDALGVSRYAKDIAGEYGVDYRTPVYAIHKNGHYGSIVGRGFDTMKEYRKLVEEVKESGGDFIKIMVSGIVDFKELGVITGTCLKREEIQEMIHIAHEEGFAVMVHVNGKQAFLDSVESGADSVEHGNYIDAECIDALLAKNTVWVPTLVTIKNLLGSGRYEDTTVKKIYDLAAANVKSAFSKGAVLALGSDAGAYRVPHGTGICDEYQAFIEILDVEKQEADWRLEQGEEQIRSRFQTGFNAAMH